MKPSVRRRRYMREAALLLGLAKIAVLLVPMQQIGAWANRPLRHVKRFAADQVPWVAWSIETVGARPWIKAACLPRALAGHAMLRRRGIPSRLCLAVAADSSTSAAYAWVEIANGVVIGAAEAARVKVLTHVGGGRSTPRTVS